MCGAGRPQPRVPWFPATGSTPRVTSLQPQGFLREEEREEKDKARRGLQEPLGRERLSSEANLSSPGSPIPLQSVHTPLSASPLLPHTTHKDYWASGWGCRDPLASLLGNASSLAPPPHPLHSPPSWREQTRIVRLGPLQGILDGMGCVGVRGVSEGAELAPVIRKPSASPSSP